MERGTVKFFNNRDDKLYGFIVPDANDFGNDVFFHFNSGKGVKPRENILYEPSLVDGDLQLPKKGDRVVFEKKMADKGPKAGVWAYEEDWDRANTAKLQQGPDLGDTFGCCPVCRKEVGLKASEPEYPDDPMLGDVHFYVLAEHPRPSGFGTCSGVGQHPRYVCDDLGYDEDGSRSRSDGEEEERRGHFDRD